MGHIMHVQGGQGPNTGLNAKCSQCKKQLFNGLLQLPIKVFKSGYAYHASCVAGQTCPQCSKTSISNEDISQKDKKDKKKANQDDENDHTMKIVTTEQRLRTMNRNMADFDK